MFRLAHEKGFSKVGLIAGLSKAFKKLIVVKNDGNVATLPQSASSCKTATPFPSLISLQIDRLSELASVLLRALSL